MYVLYKLEHRAETTDTLLFYASNNYETLQEIMLSIFDEMIEQEIVWAEREYDDDFPIDYHSICKWCIERMRPYGITWLPYLED